MQFAPKMKFIPVNSVPLQAFYRYFPPNLKARATFPKSKNIPWAKHIIELLNIEDNAILTHTSLLQVPQVLASLL